MDEKEKRERAEAWERYVRSEVGAYLAAFLGNSSSGTIGIKYINPVKRKSETGIVYDRTKAVAVKMILNFEFEEEIEVPEEE